MAYAVFLRAVNVGGTGVTSVAAIAKKLGLTNIGAAGTFVSHKKTSAAALRKAIAAELGFETPIIVVKGSEIQKLVASKPFARVEGKPYITVLEKKPKNAPKFPLDGKGVRYLRIDGPFLLSVVLPDAKPGTAIGSIEKTLGVAGTARGWPTIERVAKALGAEE